MSAAVDKKPRHRLFIGGLAALVVASGIGAFFIRTSDAPKKKAAPSNVINITLPPPLPPPPPPPPPQNEPPPPEEQKMVEQEPVAEEEKPPEAPSPEQPPSDLTTNLKGDGGNNFGLSQGSGRGGSGGNGTGGGGLGGSKWGWYASGIQRSLTEALRRHPSTRNATFSLKVRIWPDATGRVTRAQLVGSTGSPSLDEVLRNQILTGHQLSQAPPSDMPLPIVMRLSARKP